MSDFGEDDSCTATIDDSGIHYVYHQDFDDESQHASQDDGEEEQEAIAEQYQILTTGAEIKSETSDVPSVRAILVDGQYYLTDGDQTLLFQDSDDGSDPMHQYYINENSGYAIDDTSLTTEEDNSTQFVQLVEDPNENSNQQIIYYTDASLDVDDSSNSQPAKRIKLETGQMVDLETFLQQQQESGNGNVHYAVMEDGSIHKIANADDVMETPVEDEPEELENSEDVAVDLSQITGTNLITGQKVTLHSYMEKLQKKLRKKQELPVAPSVSIKRRSQDDKLTNEEYNLLNKKIPIGKTKSGKKIVGKIVKVEKKTEETFFPLPLTEDEEEEEEEEEEDEEEPKQTGEQHTTLITKTKVIVKKSPVTKETFEQISKTLGGVMEMESVRKKLEEKNIVVKLVEKKYIPDKESFSKSSSYSYGYMEKDYEENGEEKWRFVPDQDTQDAILDQIEDLVDKRDDEADKPSKSTKYAITTSLTILISHAKGGNKTIRVNLSPAPGNLCTICAKHFKNNMEMKMHMKRVHENPKSLKCEVCAVELEDMQSVEEHKLVHVAEGRLLACTECDKSFTTQARLHKHLSAHEIINKPLACSVCSQRWSSEWALKKHLLTHLKHVKPFECDVCNKTYSSVYDMNFHRKTHFPDRNFVCNVCLRTFSRHSNLMRHMDIHKGTGALYKCEVCYCSYNFASSLTRHIVQNHINVGDFRKKANEEGTASS